MWSRFCSCINVLTFGDTCNVRNTICPKQIFVSKSKSASRGGLCGDTRSTTRFNNRSYVSEVSFVQSDRRLGLQLAFYLALSLDLRLCHPQNSTQTIPPVPTLLRDVATIEILALMCISLLAFTAFSPGPLAQCSCFDHHLLSCMRYPVHVYSKHGTHIQLFSRNAMQCLKMR